MIQYNGTPVGDRVGVEYNYNTGLHFQIIEVVDGMVGQIVFGSTPVYQTKPRTLQGPDEYQALMGALRAHAVARLKIAFA